MVQIVIIHRYIAFKALTAIKLDYMQELNPTELAQIVMYNRYGYAQKVHMCVLILLILVVVEIA